MAKATRTRAMKEPPVPAWIHDTADQEKWNGRFLEILERDYINSDVVISAILRDERLAQRCATEIRSYVDKNFSDCLYAQTKTRGAEVKKQLEVATEGLRAAIGLCTKAGKEEFIPTLCMLLQDFSKALTSCKEAFATKRHGRDRDHAILLKWHSFLQQELGPPITYITLANLVNAGFEADESPLKEPVDEMQVRKNLANFKNNNPFWSLYSSNS